MFKTPTTALDLLENVKIALKHHLLVNEDFYRDENLKHFFGAANVTWRTPKNDEKKKWAFISNFGAMVEPLRDGSNVFEGISIAAQRTVGEAESVTGEIYVTVLNEKRLSFDSIENIFGSGWKPLLQIHRGHREGYQPATNPHGNASIVYESRGTNFKQRVEMRFAHDGTLKDATFVEVK